MPIEEEQYIILENEKLIARYPYSYEELQKYDNEKIDAVMEDPSIAFFKL